MHAPQVVSATEWTEAIEELRPEEKRATRERDALAARRLNRDLGLTTDKETFALSVFYRDGERILRTYVTDGRGVEALGSVWTCLDLTPLGRQERWEDSPASVEQEEPYQWWRRHDEYAEVTAR
jgi:predicted dithiol-disulfide oxidoreductase (DUF899 family)